MRTRSDRALGRELDRIRAERYVAELAAREDVLHLARIMRDGGMPECAWFALVATTVEAITDDRFDGATVRRYVPGYVAGFRRLAREHPELDSSVLHDLPEGVALNARWDRGRDRFCSDLFACYGFAELAALYLEDRGDFVRRVEASARFLGEGRHHHASTGFCFTSGNSGPNPRLDRGSVVLPDLLPECRTSAMGHA